MDLLKPEMLDETKSVEFQKTMLQDLRIAAKKLKGKPAWFVLAGEFPLADKKVPLFVAMKTEAEAKAWQLKMKGKKPKLLAIGTCELASPDGKKVQVALNKMKGADRKTIVKTAKLVFRLDRATSITDALAEDEDENEKGEGEAEDRPVAAGSMNQLIDQLAADNDEIKALLAQYKDLGLTENQLRAALQETLR